MFKKLLNKIKGPKGDKGDIGPIGLQGPAGPQGPAGDIPEEYLSMIRTMQLRIERLEKNII